jgi:hypothetical protein
LATGSSDVRKGGQNAIDREDREQRLLVARIETGDEPPTLPSQSRRFIAATIGHEELWRDGIDLKSLIDADESAEYEWRTLFE